MKAYEFLQLFDVNYTTVQQGPNSYLEELAANSSGNNPNIIFTVPSGPGWLFHFTREVNGEKRHLLADWTTQYGQTTMQRRACTTWARAGYVLSCDTDFEHTVRRQREIRAFLGDALADILLYEVNWLREQYIPFLPQDENI